MKNREIKFRAWDIERNEFTNDKLTASVAFEILSKESEQKNVEKFFLLMQYTGLLDKNGVEIYEGDIVEHYHLGEMVKSVIHWNEEKAMFCLRYDGDKLNGWHLNPKSLEVIGNIHQNPELCQ